MVNSSNRIYTNPVLPQKIEVQFSSAPKLEQFLSQKTDTNVADNVKVSDKLDVNTQEYRTSLESSQNYVSSAQNTLQNIDEVKKSISDYQNSDEKELKQDDFLKSIDNSLTKTQGFSSGDTSSLPDNTVGFVGVLNKIKEKKGSLYQQAATLFDTTYNYVLQIASVPSRGQRGKGKLIKDWLNEQISKDNK